MPMRKFRSGFLLLGAGLLHAQTSPAIRSDSAWKIPTVAVMDFEGRGLPTDQAATLADRFRAELSGCGAFRQVERSKMDEILREQGFQQAGCTSTECAVQTGRILGVERIVSGSVSRIGETWTVHAREIDVGTSEILRSAIVDQRGPIDEMLTKGMGQLAQRLTGGCKVAAAPQPPVQPVAKPAAPIPPVLPSIMALVKPDSSASRSQLDTGEIPFQFAIVSPAAIPAGKRVHGISLNLFYGELKSMRGVQAGLLNSVEGQTVGVQAGVLNITGEERGIQGGVMNFSRGELDGIQGGLVNYAKSSKGMQAGLINIADSCTCAQFGLLNIWKSADGKSHLFPIVGGTLIR